MAVWYRARFMRPIQRFCFLLSAWRHVIVGNSSDHSIRYSVLWHDCSENLDIFLSAPCWTFSSWLDSARLLKNNIRTNVSKRHPSIIYTKTHRTFLFFAWECNRSHAESADRELEWEPAVWEAVSMRMKAKKKVLCLILCCVLEWLAFRPTMWQMWTNGPVPSRVVLRNSFQHMQFRFLLFNDHLICTSSVMCGINVSPFHRIPSHFHLCSGTVCDNNNEYMKNDSPDTHI